MVNAIKHFGQVTEDVTDLVRSILLVGKLRTDSVWLVFPIFETKVFSCPTKLDLVIFLINLFCCWKTFTFYRAPPDYDTYSITACKQAK